MQEIQVFSNEEFGKIGIIQINDKEYFPAAECAKILGYSNSRDAILRHCKGVVKHDILTQGGNQEVNFIPEGDLYRLIVKSKLPSAEKFERWVFDEVLPTIRKTGGHVENEDLFVNTYLSHADEHTKQLFKLNLITIRQLNNKIEQLEPLAEFAETVASSSDTIDVGQLAKLVKDENINIGRNRLFDWLRKEKYLRNNNEPYQEYIDRGWFETVEYTYNTPYGNKIGIKTLVTGKGQIAIVERLRKRNVA